MRRQGEHMSKHDKPLLSALDKYTAKDRIIMHMPGHKGGKLFSEKFREQILQYDLTELPGLDNFHRAKGILAESMKACARVSVQGKPFFWVNGSTSGIHAMLAACLNPGDKLLVVRNCHISVINALILFGIQPVFIMPRYDEEWQMSIPAGIESWQKALKNYPEVKGALVTSPDYYGVCTPLQQLASLLHEEDKLLLVDEAHGAHFAFSGLLPQNRFAAGGGCLCSKPAQNNAGAHPNRAAASGYKPYFSGQDKAQHLYAHYHQPFLYC